MYGAECVRAKRVRHCDGFARSRSLSLPNALASERAVICRPRAIQVRIPILRRSRSFSPVSVFARARSGSFFLSLFPRSRSLLIALVLGSRSLLLARSLTSFSLALSRSRTSFSLAVASSCLLSPRALSCSLSPPLFAHCRSFSPSPSTLSRPVAYFCSSYLGLQPYSP